MTNFYYGQIKIKIKSMFFLMLFMAPGVRMEKIQGVLEFLGVPYTHSGLTASV